MDTPFLELPMRTDLLLLMVQACGEAARKKLAVTFEGARPPAGNHERDWPGTGTRFDFPPALDSGGECGVAYDRRFPMPLHGPDKEW